MRERAPLSLRSVSLPRENAAVAVRENKRESKCQRERTRVRVQSASVVGVHEMLCALLLIYSFDHSADAAWRSFCA